MISPLSRALVLAAARRPSIMAMTATRGFSHASVVSGPPRTRIPLAEKIVHGFVMMFSMCAVPVWVLLHLKQYRGIKE
jgi:hypothetical protein